MSIADINALNQRFYTGSLSTFASAIGAEVATYSGADHTFAIDVKGLLVDVAGIVVVDLKNTTNIALPLVAGYNPIAALAIRQTGTTVGLNIVGLTW